MVLRRVSIFSFNTDGQLIDGIIIETARTAKSSITVWQAPRCC